MKDKKEREKEKFREKQAKGEVLAFTWNYMTASIYQQIYDAHLDREFETILVKLLHYNMTPLVEAPIRHFLQEYSIIRDDFWNQFEKCNSFDMAFDRYYQYAKNKCALIDSLLDNLNFALSYDPLRKDLSIMLKDGFTF